MKWAGLGFALPLFGLIAGSPVPASADTLLDLVNAPGQSYTPYSLSFVASGSLTTLSIAGYQLPQSELATNNGLFLGGTGPNLLGSTWDFTPAASGSSAQVFSDGTAVPGLMFGGTTIGDYDTYSQTVATTTGDSYTFDFMYTNYAGPNNQPSGLIVSEVDPPPAPLPSTWTMMLAGLLGLGFIASRRRMQRVAVLAA